MSVNRSTIIKANLTSRTMSSLLEEVNQTKTEVGNTSNLPEKKMSKDIPSPKKTLTVFQVWQTKVYSYFLINIVFNACQLFYCSKFLRAINFSSYFCFERKENAFLVVARIQKKPPRKGTHTWRCRTYRNYFPLQFLPGAQFGSLIWFYRKKLQFKIRPFRYLRLG